MNAAAAYVPRTIKRHRRTRDEIEQLSAQIIEALRADHPQSVRHVYYRMTDPRLLVHVEKSDKGYRHVQHRMTELRRAGRLPYGWVSDASRLGYFVNTFSSKGDFRAPLEIHRNLGKASNSTPYEWSKSGS